MPQSPCPYCGHVPDSPQTTRCTRCGGLFEPLSRMATQLAMGPWFVRDEDRPFMPGFNEAILRQQVNTGRIKPDTIVRGPTTHQFWQRADQTQGLSRLMGKCHSCGGNVTPNAQQCGVCLADLSLPDDVDRLGLAYTDTEQRQKVQADIQAQRIAPTSAAKPAPKPVASTIHPDLLQPVQPEKDEHPEDQGQDEPTQFVYSADVSSTAQDTSAAAEIGEDLWQSDAPVAARRRARRSGPDPMVLGLGVLLLAVVSIGLFVMITSRHEGDTDKTGDTAGTVKPVERTLDEVTRIASPARTAYDKLRVEDVPEPFKQTLAQAGTLITQAEADQAAERFTEAYDKFTQADALLEPLPKQIGQWQADQEAKAQASLQLEEVKRVQAQAASAQAEQYARAAYSSGILKLGEGQAAFDKGSFSEASTLLDTALTSFQQALETAQAAAGALEAREALIAAIEKAQTEQTLRQFATNSVDRLNDLRQRGTERFNNFSYVEARQAFEDALEALREAQVAVELAKYRKFYAFQAGYQAAGVLLSVAAGDAVQDTALNALIELYDRLQLPDNPASRVQAGNQGDYAALAEQLVNAARGAITTKHGDLVQACYHAGFQARIIEQSLATLSLTDDQQKRIHQALRSFQDQATAGGWNVVELNKVIEEVREANRKAALGKAPEQARAAFAVLIKPLQQRDAASRLMDPVLSPTAPSDPELFPNRGSSRP